MKLTHLFKKYKFYVEQGWASNFTEFQIEFLKVMDEKEMDEHV